MDPPSSPPLLPDIEPPPSPLLPSTDLDDLLPIRPRLASGSRKRDYSEYSDNGDLSSDPVFSEGTSEAEEEERTEGRPRRKLVKGPWWSLRKSMAKRERLRNADSGVWLGSDASQASMDSSASLDSTVSSEEKLSRLHVAQRSQVASSSSTPAPPRSSPAEAHATQIVNYCLDTGREVVDLSDLGLTRLQEDAMRSLHQLIRHPPHHNLTEPPNEDVYVPLTPSIQLFLSGNKLSTLPRELFRLVNITVLSLRNNELTDIPHHIGRLSGLKELNVAQNRVRWLPWEMLDVLHCRGVHRQISTRPNPFINPIPRFSGPSPLPRIKVTQGEFNEHLSRWGETSGAFCGKMREWYSEEGAFWTMRHELELKLKLGRIKRTNYLQEASDAGTELLLCNEQLIYLASSAIRYFEVDGSPLRSGKTTGPINATEIYQAVMEQSSDTPRHVERASIPSLFELSLRTLQNNFDLQNETEYPEALPSSVASALKKAASGVAGGNETCSSCGKDYIIARAEWMEYWFTGFPAQEHLTCDSVLPFLRKACSWSCARPSELGAFRL